MLCSGLVDDGRDHRRHMEPRFNIVSQYPTSWDTLVTDNYINIHIKLDW